MAQLFLKGLNLKEVNTYLTDKELIQKDALFQKTHQARIERSENWRNYIGYTRGKTVQSIAPKSLLIMMGGQSNMTGLAKRTHLADTELPKNLSLIHI